MAKIDVRHVSIGYGNRTLKEQIDFSLDGPVFTALVGHNGSGKSTFLRALTRSHVYSGKITINGVDLQSMDQPAKVGVISLLEQQNAIAFDIPVKELVMMGRFRFVEFFGDYTKEDELKVQEAMEFLCIDHYKDKNFQELSGGEQQLVWLAQMMVQDPEIILLDEPTQNLDVANKRRVFEWMQRIVDQKQKIVICATHDIHNLYDMRGELLNFTRDKVVLASISKETIDQELSVLYQGETVNYSSIG